MTLEEIKAIAETWFDWPEEDRCHVTYTSAMLFARDMYERGQKAERDKYAELIAAAEAVIKQWEPPLCPVIYRLLDVIERMKNEN